MIKIDEKLEFMKVNAVKVYIKADMEKTHETVS
jgi:hypothetical protein